ncbi:helix-turn-helix domain-containing protein [Corynebacterium cystitidis]|uniref:helix-turn-helix domain-containing protein n=1 Tax=Corynebacterium cystitidis TaxID=35757 RepID=UPI00211E8734|nr:helix-turn-helix domain-containing protein [Corynebacterium cystitidis]
MTSATTRSFELSNKIQAQAQDVLGSAHSINSVDGSALPPELSALFDAVLRAAAHGEALTISPLPDILTTTEAARQLGISRPTLMRRIDDGQIKAFKVGTHTRIRAEDLEKYRCERHGSTAQTFEAMRKLDHQIFN